MGLRWQGRRSSPPARPRKSYHRERSGPAVSGIKAQGASCTPRLPQTCHYRVAALPAASASRNHNNLNPEQLPHRGNSCVPSLSSQGAQRRVALVAALLAVWDVSNNQSNPLHPVHTVYPCKFTPDAKVGTREHRASVSSRIGFCYTCLLADERHRTKNVVPPLAAAGAGDFSVQFLNYPGVQDNAGLRRNRRTMGRRGQG